MIQQHQLLAVAALTIHLACMSVVRAHAYALCLLPWSCDYKHLDVSCWKCFCLFWHLAQSPSSCFDHQDHKPTHLHGHQTCATAKVHLKTVGRQFVQTHDVSSVLCMQVSWPSFCTAFFRSKSICQDSCMHRTDDVYMFMYNQRRPVVLQQDSRAGPVLALGRQRLLSGPL